MRSGFGDCSGEWDWKRSIPNRGCRCRPRDTGFTRTGCADLEIIRPDQVWATDITYIRLRQGFIYLVAIMDWFSRYVLAWEVSTTMDSGFCVSALDWALTKAQPEIFNSDQGAQFTSDVFTRIGFRRPRHHDQHGRPGPVPGQHRRRALVWRTVKYEEVYLKDYLSVPEAMVQPESVFQALQSGTRPEAFDYRTPEAVYFQRPPRACGN